MPTFGQPRRHKEWQHFVILAPAVDLLVNFSCCDDARSLAAPEDEFPRIVLLVRPAEHTRRVEWDGDVETFDVGRAQVRGGLIDMTLAHNRLVFEDGAFHISVRLAERPVGLELRLVPRTMPVFVPRIPMIEGPLLNWVVVPRLDVHGWLEVGDRRFTFERAPAYHDHNWGPFLWGHDCSWDWGFVLPDEADSPWSLTWVRLSNRARTTALAQYLLLWRREGMQRIFCERQLELRVPLAHLRPPRVFKVPRAMSLVAPEVVADVPCWLEVSGRAEGDWIECRAEAYDMAQVLIPSEARLGVTIFNEVAARTEVRGRVAGEDVRFAGKSILEFIRVY
jgi:hypothetical protein